MKIKKLLALLLPATLLMSVASCGSSNGTASSESSSSASSNTSSSVDTSSSADAPNANAYAPQENGVGNTTLSGIEIKDVDGDGVIRVACVGDSITAGTSETNYPMYLQEYLNYLGSIDGKTYEVKNHGKGAAACHHVEEELGDPNWGWSTVTDADGDGKAYFYYDDIAYTSLNYTPDVVIVQMGTNDALGSDWDSYFNDDYYNYLVKPFKDKGALVILSTPPYACNGMHDTNVNGSVHDKEVQLAWDLGLPIVDTNRLIYGWNEILADGLHGNLTGYTVMAQNFYKYIFGGETITATLKSEPNTRFTLVDTANNRSYCRVTDANGIATLEFLPGSYSFNVSAECTGFKSAKTTATMDSDKTITVELVEGGYNVAPNGTAFAGDAETYSAENTAASVIDGSRDTVGYQPKTWTEGDYVGVELKKAYEVNNVVVYWESAAYVSEFNDNGYEIWFKIGNEWKKMSASDVTVTRAVYSGEIISDNIAVEPAMSIEGVKIVYRNGTITEHKYSPKMYELEILTDNRD